jgi:hypothetical protein
VKISNLRVEGARVEARVEWEDCQRPELRIFWETEPEYADALRPDPSSILIAAFFPAARHGEHRIALEGPISPRLRDGLRAVSALFRSWYGGERRSPDIESAKGIEAPYPRTPARAAAFLSGGIDSLFTLRRNRLDLPREHPRSIRDSLWLTGRDFPGMENSPEALRHSERLGKALKEVAKDAGTNLVAIRTNSRQLEPDVLFLGYEFQAAWVASAAHVLASRFDVVSFSSGWDIAHTIPWGSHPLVDPNFGTEAIEIRHDGIAFGRAEKLRQIATWNTAIRNLVVCNEIPSEPSLNCGRCYKCVETMTLLLSEGLLSGTAQFPERDVTPEKIDRLTLAPNLRSSFSDYSEFWKAMIPALERARRNDLIEAVRRKLEDARRLEAWLEEKDWKGRLKRLDRRLSGGLGVRAVRALLRRG